LKVTIYNHKTIITITTTFILGNEDTDFNSFFYCPISKVLMEHPVIDIDGNTYERSAIELWLRVKQSSPITGNEMDASTLRPNQMVKHLIEEAKKRKALPVRLKGKSMFSQLEESM
jgi:hypothetical protein